jgi:hypothetical protein
LYSELEQRKGNTVKDVAPLLTKFASYIKR